MDAVLDKCIEMQSKAAEMKFKTWNDVCASWLADLRAAS
jgi:hypothetical protein